MQRANFSGTPSVRSHEYEFTEKDLHKIDMMSSQFDMVQFISVVSIIMYVGLIIMATCSEPEIKSENKEEV